MNSHCLAIWGGISLNFPRFFEQGIFHFSLDLEIVATEMDEVNHKNMGLFHEGKGVIKFGGQGGF